MGGPNNQNTKTELLGLACKHKAKKKIIQVSGVKLTVELMVQGCFTGG